jgi:hypothetical protein
MLFKEFPSNQENKKINRIKRPERNRKEQEAQAREELSPFEIRELMGTNDRGHKRRRGAWRQA